MQGAGTRDGLTRRQILTYGAGVGAMAFAGALWGGTAMAPGAAVAVAEGVGPYGPLLAPDAHGLALPPG